MHAARWAARTSNVTEVGARARWKTRATIRAERRGFTWDNLFVCSELVIFFFLFFLEVVLFIGIAPGWLVVIGLRWIRPVESRRLEGICDLLSAI